MPAGLTLGENPVSYAGVIHRLILTSRLVLSSAGKEQRGKEQAL